MITTKTRLPSQMLPDFYDTPEQCMAAAKTIPKPTNPRYSNFRQTHFTAGDEEQFQAYRDPTNGEICIPDIDISCNLFSEQPFPTWDKYSDVGAEAVIGTFRYIFNKFKKGIFVKIQDNKLAVFLPFSKANFTNEWSSYIHIDPKYKDLNDFLEASSGSYKFNPGKVNHNIKEWYANNCIVRYDIDYRTRKPNEGDTNVGTIKNMLETLCERRIVPDIEFFINRRDFPLLTRDGTEPYDSIWGDRPLVSYNLPKYIPILSMSKTKKYADILIPTHEDWARVQSLNGIWFPRSCRDYVQVFDTPWKDKKSTAVFRGASTGCGVTIETNPRLKLAYIGATYKQNTDEPLLDVGITKWNLRPRKVKDSKYLQIIDVEQMNNKGIHLVNFLSLQEQSTYRYIINVDGHVSAFRLSIELGMGSVILLAESKWKLWYTDLLVPYEHYVPINSDLSDLIQKIEWCRQNDNKCQEIASNSRKFFDTYLQEKGILDYLQKSLVDMKSEMGVYLYNTQTPLDTQISNEFNDISLSLSYPETSKNSSNINEIPWFSSRTFGLLLGVHWAINMALHEREISSVLVKKDKIFTNKLGTVNKYLFGNKNARSRFPLAIKTTSDPGKSREHIHEVFVGTKAINLLLKHIPNFTYTFGLHQSPSKEISVINEFIPGITLADYMKSKKLFNLGDLMSILAQICLAIQVAQNRCGLVHYDLAPWNIILQPSNDYVVVDYVISYDNVIRVKTNLVPVIIDYGKAHVIVDQEHHGFIDMFRVSTIQDVLSILLYSLDSIIKNHTLEKKDFSALMRLSEFIVGTKYRRNKFKGAKDLKSFLQSAVKYTTLITQPKYELEDRSPMDLFKWIYKIGGKYNLSFVKNYSKTKVVRNIMDKSNGRQIFEYILSNTTEERAQTYFNVFSRLKQCTIPQPKNLFFVYYAVQAFITNLKSVNDDMNQFLSRTSYDRPRTRTRPGGPMAAEEYSKAYNDSISFLARVYEPKLDDMKEHDIEYKIKGDSSILIRAPYTSETFLNPSSILELLKTMDYKVDISEYQDIITTILLNTGKYRLPEEIRKHYIQNFSKLLKVNSLYMKNNCANLVTLRVLAKSIYSKDSEILSSKLPGVGNCSSAKNYLKNYNMVLNNV